MPPVNNFINYYTLAGQIVVGAVAFVIFLARLKVALQASDEKRLKATNELLTEQNAVLWGELNTLKDRSAKCEAAHALNKTQMRELRDQGEKMQSLMDSYEDEREMAVDLFAECMEIIKPLANGRHEVIQGLYEEWKKMPAQASRKARTLQRMQDFKRAEEDKEAV